MKMWWILKEGLIAIDNSLSVNPFVILVAELVVFLDCQRHLPKVFAVLNFSRIMLKL